MRGNQNKQPKGMCPKCGKENWGECQMGTNVCFKCGKDKHMAGDYGVGQKPHK